MKNSELEQLINDKLNSAAISDFAPNGLQVEGRETVHKIVTGVTACQQTDGLIQQRLAGRHSGDDLVHRFASFHLQTVRGEVTDGRTIELDCSSRLFLEKRIASDPRHEAPSPENPAGQRYQSLRLAPAAGCPSGAGQ